jgi:hypothetical protein
MNYIWKKPVLTFYREKYPPEREPFAVAKSIKLEISKTQENKLTGTIDAFFPLMGNLDCLSSVEGLTEKYVLCWFDDTVDDINSAFRRVTGVTFSSQVSYVLDEKGKKTYFANFEALSGKLK